MCDDYSDLISKNILINQSMQLLSYIDSNIELLLHQKSWKIVIALN